MFWFLWPWGMWDLCSPTRDWTHTPCIERWSLNHWTSRKVPCTSFTTAESMIFLCLSETLGWRKHKLESRLPGEISITSDDTSLMAESEEELRSLLMKVKEESEKVGLKPNIQRTKIMASGPITSWKIDGETVESVRLSFSGLQNHCRWWLPPWN